MKNILIGFNVAQPDQGNKYLGIPNQISVEGALNPNNEFF